jgi:hypothetical protein
MAITPPTIDGNWLPRGERSPADLAISRVAMSPASETKLPLGNRPEPRSHRADLLDPQLDCPASFRRRQELPTGSRLSG